ncbi:golgin subfamily A member 2 [Phlebotomus papatasi]|uniref:Golgin subfamily A conserved domain-containing protein n=1 Tax=Phlebotomus papatasi TaxID=29031 RepID=A0A1B0CZ35_PHLPP|nr:golgin subfamily A member 2 [Phlebotomus papatasi]
MSDNKSKAEKLADGRKKLKKFQSKQKKPKADDDRGGNEQITPSENGSEDQVSISSVPEVFPSASAIFLANDTHGASVDFQGDILGEKSVLVEEMVPQEPLPEVTGKIAEMPQNLSVVMRPEPRRTPPHRESLKDELFTLLDSEKSRIVELEGRVREQSEVIEGLKKQIEVLRTAPTAPSDEVAHLREQLHSHVQTLGVLVGEKADLTAQLGSFQVLLTEKDREIEELQAKLSASRHQVQDSRAEMAYLRESMQKFEQMQQNLCSENENAREKVKFLKDKCEDLSEEVAQVNQKLLLKTRECSKLVEEAKKRDSELSLAQLRVEQLSAGDTQLADGKIEGMAQQRQLLEQHVGELLTQVEKITVERDQAASQYQNYVSQLNRESTKLMQKVQETSQERDQLARREAELVKHVGELERQLQAQIAQPKAQSPQQEVQNDESGQKIQELENYLRELRLENQNLKASLSKAEESCLRVQSQLEQKVTSMSELEMKIERLETSYVDPSSLSATLESEKVAAARAVAQNVELKAQLEEMQTAYVQMTHDKAALMDQLQSEQHLGREMRGKLDGWEDEVGGLREKLHYKDEEMMRLSHENSELEKKTLLQSQELDRLRHCEMGQQTSNVLQMEVQRLMGEIGRLEERIRKYEEKKEKKEEVQEEKEDGQVQEVLENGQKEKEDGEVEAKILPTEEAMQKLEERFRRTMNDIAELTEEKHRLEHLVTQLQGETETIGEYVTLYQTQRQLLKQREIEKDVQVQRIAADREEMRQKLIELNSLVELLLRQKNIDIPTELSGSLNGDSQDEDLVKPASGSPENDNQKVQSETLQVPQDGQSEETAERILSLLSEIKTSNLNTTNLVVPPGVVHHCSCCSGKLITV